MEFIRVASMAEIPEGELRAFELPFGTRQKALTKAKIADSTLVAHVAVQGQALLIQSPGGGVFALFDGDNSQIAERHGDALLVAQFAPECQVFFIQRLGRSIVALFFGQNAQIKE